MAYSEQTWADGSGGATPVTAARLLHIEDGIAAAVAHDVLTYNVQDHGVTPGADGYTALTALIAAVPEGSELFFPPAASAYLFSAQIMINRKMSLRGNWNRDSATGAFGSILSPTTSGVQGGMESLICVNAAGVLIEGLALVGKNNATSIGILAAGATGRTSHNLQVRRCLSYQFATGISMGKNADHVTCYDSVFGGTDSVRMAVNNLFDFAFIDCDLTGALNSSVLVEDTANVDNVLFLRTHLGFSPWGIYQPTQTSGGIVGLTMIASPIEQVTSGHITLYGYGNWLIDSSCYWTWTTGATSTHPMLDVVQVSAGGITFRPRLEPTLANSNSPSVIRVTGFTNFAIAIDSALNGNAVQLINYGGSVDLARVFVQGLPYGGQAKGAKDVAVTATSSDQIIVTVNPVDHGLFSAQIFLHVTTTTTVTLKFVYNDGSSAVTELILNGVSLTAGNYHYATFASCFTYNAPTVTVRASTANTVYASATIAPERHT